jgi:hypothetical protein
MEEITLNKALAPIALTAFLLTLAPGCQKPDVQQVAETPAPAATEAASPAGDPAGDPAEAGQAQPAAAQSGTVMETMDAGGYTYVQVDTGSELIWAAAPQFTVAVGDQVTIPPGMPMANYHSNSLDRDFDVVYFVSAIMPADAEGLPVPDPTAMAPVDLSSVPGHPAPGKAADAAGVDLSDVEKAEGGHTVAEIFSGKEDLSGQQVSIRGKVVKFSAGIMGKNWLHLQDGTAHEGANDLTITTDAVVNKGDTVLVRGTLVTDKDFGAGYRYDVIIEEAEVTQN